MWSCSAGLIKSVRAVLRGVPLHVLIRPRGGDFIYTHNEMQVQIPPNPNYVTDRICSGLPMDGIFEGDSN